MAKTLVSFRLSDTTRDELQECVDLVRQRDEAEGNAWIAARRDRTDIVRMAVANLLAQLKRQAEDATKETPAKPISRKKRVASKK